MISQPNFNNHGQRGFWRGPKSDSSKNKHDKGSEDYLQKSGQQGRPGKADKRSQHTENSGNSSSLIPIIKTGNRTIQILLKYSSFIKTQRNFILSASSILAESFSIKSPNCIFSARSLRL